MWYAALLRFIRRRLVLALIFILSLSYFLINVIGNGGPLSFDSDSNEFEIKRIQPIEWQTSKKYNSTNDLTSDCRNSVQGKVLIVDDRGFVCSRSDLLWTGCCNIEVKTTKQFNCETCTDNDCCAIYEYCVSCCLNPDKRNLLEKIIAKATGRQMAIFATVKDHFELCLAKCRTDSHSVQHENKYRDPKSRHCYGETKAHESQIDVNNNVVL